ADRNRSHWSTSKTPSYTKSVSWQHHRIPDNWDKLNNKRTNNVYYLSRRTMASKKSSIKKE
ncbi:hypothetical protein, partial [Escherichia coli]